MSSEAYGLRGVAPRKSHIGFLQHAQPALPHESIGSRMREQLETVSPVPQHTRIVPCHKCAQELRETERQQLAHGGGQKGSTRSAAFLQGRYENPRQVRAAQAALDALLR